jgi:spermidine/putrescine transport system permease protein
MQEVIRNEGVINRSCSGPASSISRSRSCTPTGRILFGMVYVYLPLMVLPLYASMEKLDFRLVEAGYDLYANALQGAVADHHAAGEARHHRRLDPRLHSVARRLCDARVLGGGKNMMLGNLIDLQFGQGRNWPLGAALSITLMVIVMLALLVYVRNATKTGARPWLGRAVFDQGGSRASPPLR